MKWGFLGKIRTRKIRPFISDTNVEVTGKIKNKEEMFTIIKNIVELKSINKEVLNEINKFLKTLITDSTFSQIKDNYIYNKGSNEEKQIINNFSGFLTSLKDESKEKYINEIIDFIRLFKRKGVFNSQYSFSDLMDGMFNIKENNIDFILKATESYYKRHYESSNSGFSYGSSGFDFDYGKFYNNLSVENKKIAQRKFMQSPVFFDYLLIENTIFYENTDLIKDVEKKYMQFCKKQYIYLIERDAINFLKKTNIFIYKDVVMNLFTNKDYLADLSKDMSRVKSQPLNFLINAFIYNQDLPSEEKRKNFTDVLLYLKDNRDSLIKDESFFTNIYDVINSDFYNKKIDLPYEDLIFIYTEIYSIFPEVFKLNKMNIDFFELFIDDKKTFEFFFNEDLKNNQIENNMLYSKIFINKKDYVSSSYEELDDFLSYINMFSKINKKEDSNNTYEDFIVSEIEHNFLHCLQKSFLRDSIDSEKEMKKMDKIISFTDDNPFLRIYFIRGLIKYSLSVVLDFEDNVLLKKILDRAKNDNLYPFSEFFNHYFGSNIELHPGDAEKIVSELSSYVALLDVSNFDLIYNPDIKLQLKVLYEKEVLNNIIKTDEVISKPKKRI